MAIGDVIYRHVIVIEESNSPFGFKHTFPCPVCKKELAVMNSNNGTMAPCWNCQSEGYALIKVAKNDSKAKILELALSLQRNHIRIAAANKKMPGFEKKSNLKKNLRRKIR